MKKARKSKTRTDVIIDLIGALAEADGTDDETARDVTEKVLGLVIARLRADAEIPARTVPQWEMFFASVAERATDDLWWLGGMVSQNEAVRVIADRLESNGK
jgi:hypothetical protein